MEQEPSNTSQTNVSGFKTRMKNTNGGEKWDVSAPIFDPLFLQHLPLIPMCSLNFEFALNHFSAVVKSGLRPADIATCNYRVFNPRLRFKKISVTSEYAMSFERMLTSRPARYDITNFKTLSYVIPQGLRTFSQNDVFCSNFLPQQCVIAFSLQSSSAGSTDTSIFTMEHNNVSRLRLLMADDTCPSYEEELNVEEKKCLNWYDALNGDNWSSSFIAISKSQFEDEHTLFYLNLNSMRFADTIQPKKLCTATLQVDFRANTPAVLRVYVFFTEHQFFQIGFDRKVIKNF